MELGINLRINNARRTVLARVSGLVVLITGPESSVDGPFGAAAQKRKAKSR